jgi:hypothetical protein
LGEVIKTLEALDTILEVRQGGGFRKHLGASVLGEPCARKVWYTFRWAKQVRFKARMLRLFDRGNLEETRFKDWLRKAGIHVVDIDPKTGQQYRIEDFDGHLGGSGDSLLFDTPDFPGEWVLGEFKTHSDKYFKIVSKGVKKNFFKHYVQMQLYMGKFGLRAAIYFAINKNDDDIYAEIVPFDQEVYDKYLERGGKIIYAQSPPARISESSAWYECKFCDYSLICHNGAPMAHNCRTCANSVPAKDFTWFCNLYQVPLGEKEQRQGCRSHTPIQQ